MKKMHLSLNLKNFTSPPRSWWVSTSSRPQTCASRTWRSRIELSGTGQDKLRWGEILKNVKQFKGKIFAGWEWGFLQWPGAARRTGLTQAHGWSMSVMTAPRSPGKSVASRRSATTKCRPWRSPCMKWVSVQGPGTLRRTSNQPSQPSPWK